MLSFTLTVDIARDLDTVFAYVTDPGKLPEWQRNTVAVTAEPPPPLRRGTHLREVRKGPFGKTVESLVEVTALEPNRTFGLRILEGPLPVDGHHTFAAHDGGTRIEVAIDGRPRGGLRLAQPLLRPLLRSQFERHYAELKRRLEQP
jgi:uncharacterized membrane protein